MWYILSWTFTFLLISDLQIVTEVSHDSSDTVFLSTRVQFGFHFHLQGVQLWIEEPNKWSSYLGLLPASHEARLWWNCSGSVTFGSSIADKGERHTTKAAVVKTRAGSQPAAPQGAAHRWLGPALRSGRPQLQLGPMLMCSPLASRVSLKLRRAPRRSQGCCPPGQPGHRHRAVPWCSTAPEPAALGAKYFKTSEKGLFPFRVRSCQS